MPLEPEDGQHLRAVEGYVALGMWIEANASAQMGQLEVGKARLAHAFKLDPSWRLEALDDEDLRPVWDSLK